MVDKWSIIIPLFIVTLGASAIIFGNMIASDSYDRKINEWENKDLETLSCEIVYKKLLSTTNTDPSYDGKMIRLYETIESTWNKLDCDNHDSSNWKGLSWIYTQTEQERINNMIKKVDERSG